MLKSNGFFMKLFDNIDSIIGRNYISRVPVTSWVLVDFYICSPILINIIFTKSQNIAQVDLSRWKLTLASVMVLFIFCKGFIRYIILVMLFNGLKNYDYQRQNALRFSRSFFLSKYGKIKTRKISVPRNFSCSGAQQRLFVS